MSEPIWTTIKVTKTDPHIGVLTMSRLAQRNAINAQMADELEKCLESLKSDRDLRALILTGGGNDLWRRCGPEGESLARP